MFETIVLNRRPLYDTSVTVDTNGNCININVVVTNDNFVVNVRDYEVPIIVPDFTPRPKPWLQHNSVVPRFKNVGVTPYRPRQHRSRDGI